MKKIYFYVNADKPRAKAAWEVLSVEARKFGLVETYAYKADVIITLGGDGTILRAVHEFPKIPVLGLNLGGLGYLASVEEKDFVDAIRMLAEGRYRVAERSALGVRIGDSELARALNDIVITREMSGHSIVLDLEVDGRAATRYMADGLIVATPTGSTAYSLAAGGPVLMPESRSFVVTPMSPHALGIRPMVLSDASTIRVTARRRTNGVSERIGVYADGKNIFMLNSDESMDIVRAERGAAMIELDGYDPYGVMARKLGWSGSVVK